MNFRWLGPLALLAVLVIADQIRINRPGHKYRLTVEVKTPEGVKSASGILAVQPDRGYSRSGHTRTMGDAVLLDLGGGKNLIALLAHVDKTVELDGMNFLALRAYNAAGRKVSFNDMSRMTGPVPVQGALEGASGRGIAGRRGDRPKTGLHAEIAMQPRAGPRDIDPVLAGGHDQPHICGKDWISDDEEAGGRCDR